MIKTNLKRDTIRAQTNSPRTSLGALRLMALAIAITITAPTPVRAQNVPERATSPGTSPQTDLRRYVPDTVSEVWRQVYAGLPDPTKAAPMPGPNDMEGWQKA